MSPKISRLAGAGRCVLAIVACALMGVSGCGGMPPMSQSALAELETRVVEAGRDDSYRAAAAALFDAGYVIYVSDHAGGLITGQREIDRSTERLFFNSSIQDSFLQLSLHVKQVAPGRSTVRVRSAIDGMPVVAKESVDQIWTLMQRQVLMSEPPRDAPAPGKG